MSVHSESVSNACEIAQKHLKVSQETMKARFDQKAKMRVFKPGDTVLVLLPLTQEPLAARFSGPYKVEKRLNDVNYVINTPDR